jgi:CheY-like chemotaxis protein
LNVESFAGPWAQAPICQTEPIGSSTRRSPLPQAPAPNGLDGDAEAARRNDRAEIQSRRSLLLIDDVRLRRECLFHLLSAELPDFNVAAATTAQSAESWPGAAPNVILVSEPAVGEDGRWRIGEIIAAANGAPVLLLTDSVSDDAAAASEPGIVGQFPSACGAAVLIAAIQLALAGGRFQISARPEAAAASCRGHGAAR